MAGTLFGRKPGALDLSWGIVPAGTTRASIMGRPSVNGWLYRLGARVGSYEDGTVPMRFLLYGTAGGNTITERLALTSQVNVSTPMRDRASGGDVEANVEAPVRVWNSLTYALAVSAYGTVDGAFGQDASGTLMHDRSATAPNSYNADTVSPQGKISLWGVIQGNRRPNTPTNFTPRAGGVSVTPRPVLGADRVVRFLLGIAGKLRWSESDLHLAPINGTVGLLMRHPVGGDSTYAFDVDEGRIRAIYVMRNPDKLRGFIAGAE